MSGLALRRKGFSHRCAQSPSSAFYGRTGHLGNGAAQVVWRGEPEFQSHRQPFLKSSLKISVAVVNRVDNTISGS